MIPNPQGKVTTPSVVSYTRRASANTFPAKLAPETEKLSEKVGNSIHDHANNGGDNDDDDGVTLSTPIGDGVPSQGGVALGDVGDAMGVLVGTPAMERIPIDPRNTFSSVKRVIGRTLKEAKEAGVSLGALNVDQVQVDIGILECLFVSLF